MGKKEKLIKYMHYYIDISVANIIKDIGSGSSDNVPTRHMLRNQNLFNLDAKLQICTFIDSSSNYKNG